MCNIIFNNLKLLFVYFFKYIYVLNLNMFKICVLNYIAYSPASNQKEQKYQTILKYFMNVHLFAELLLIQYFCINLNCASGKSTKSAKFAHCAI